MNWILQLLFRWRDRRRPELSFVFTGDIGGNERRIEFGTKLTNDGTKIARGVVVRGFLDDEQVSQADPVDVPIESAPVRVPVLLERPAHADLAKALNDRPIFHGRTFTATAQFGTRTLRAAWPHD